MAPQLAISVQKYPIIFDKSNKDFHRKYVKEKCVAGAEELGLEDDKVI